MKLLSVLICSLHKRKVLLDRLLTALQPQLTPEVELLIDTDDGEVPTGVKRNRMMEIATGEYVCFIDDDDMISDDYISKLTCACRQGPDSVGLRGVVTKDGKLLYRFLTTHGHPKEYKFYNGTVYQPIDQRTPVRRSLALQAKNDPTYRGEDTPFSDRVKPLIKSVINVDGELYFYQFVSNDTTKPPDDSVIKA